MRQPSFRFVVVTLSCSLLLVAGCGNLLGKGTQTPTKFYQLNAVSAPVHEEGIWQTGEKPLALGLAVDIFPEHLKRAQIVTRTSDNKLNHAEFDHWAEPLQRNFTRVLAENLAAALSTDRIYVFPWRKPRHLDNELLVDVLRFDGEFGGEVVLTARWSIFDKNGEIQLLVKSAKFTEIAEAEEYEAQVAAMSRAIEMLSRDIAESIKNLRQEVSG